MGLEKYVLNGNPICCAANVVSGEHYRISMLTTALVRLEYSENGEYPICTEYELFRGNHEK